jgi:hypothetical protein
MVLLNGADGMAETFTKALAMGGTGLGLARQLLAQLNGNGNDNGNRQAPNGTSPHDGAAAPAAQQVAVDPDRS